MDDFGFEQAVDRLGQGIVITVTYAVDGRFDPSLSQPFGIANGQVLRSAVGMMQQTNARLALMNSLFQRIQYETGMRRPADAPPDDTAGEGEQDARGFGEQEGMRLRI